MFFADDGSADGAEVGALSKFGAVLLRMRLARERGDMCLRSAVGDSSCLIVKLGSDGDCATVERGIPASGESDRAKSHSSVDADSDAVKLGPEEMPPKGPELKTESLLG